jgi:hypothetical protein
MSLKRNMQKSFLKKDDAGWCHQVHAYEQERQLDYVVPDSSNGEGH